MNSPLILRWSLSLLFVVLAFSQGVSQSSDCKEIKAKVVVTHSSPGGSDGKIQVVVEDGPSKVHLHLFTPGQNAKTSIEALTIENLRKGKYLVVVSEKRPSAEFCPRAIEVSVQ